jgi:cell cycle checkpoint control protein RAD9A
LKAFTKALVCLSKYGDDLTLHATPESLSLSATNSSLSAYCRFKYAQQFFSKYRVGEGNAGKFTQASLNEPPLVSGQLLVKVS